MTAAGLGNFGYVEQTITVLAGRLLEFRNRKFTCDTGTFTATFTPTGGTTTTLYSDSTSVGCTAIYATHLVSLANLAGQSGKLRLAILASPTSTTEVLVDDVASVPAVVKGDMNGDRKTDLIFAQPSSIAGCEQHDVWYMSEAQRLGVGPLPTTCQGPVRGCDDFDGDLMTDLVSVDAAGLVWIHYGSSSAQVIAAPLGPDWQLAATGDFNNDAHPDLLWRNTVTQALRIWVLDSVGYLGTIVPSPDRAVDANWNVVAALDVDDDGARDLLWYNHTTGKIVFWFMDPNVRRITGRFANPPNAGDNNWKVVAAGNYGVGANGLAHTTDLVWRNETSGNLVIWFMDLAGNRTSGTFTNPALSPAGWTVAGPR